MTSVDMVRLVVGLTEKCVKVQRAEVLRGLFAKVLQGRLSADDVIVRSNEDGTVQRESEFKAVDEEVIADEQLRRNM